MTNLLHTCDIVEALGLDVVVAKVNYWKVKATVEAHLENMKRDLEKAAMDAKEGEQ